VFSRGPKIFDRKSRLADATGVMPIQISQLAPDDKRYKSTVIDARSNSLSTISAILECHGSVGDASNLAETV
jgi:hypothetical protein